MGVIITRQCGRELAALHACALKTLNEHTNDRGHYLACGSGWPCAWAILADHNLALTSAS
jgi:hypothetical protein